MLAAIVLPACNAKDDDETTDSYLAAESVAVTAFSLSPDLRVMRNLDSVFFSIDLEHGVIFNADSLPKGTDITKLMPKIKYPSSVKSAVIEMKGGTHREDGTVNYMLHPNDTIDFTGEVTLTLATANDALSKTYRLKVNVHLEEPDTLFWEQTAESPLPSRLPEPRAQKTVKYGNGVVSLIEENDYSLTLAFSDDIFAGTWRKREVTIPHTPQIEWFTAMPDGGLYVLGLYGQLLYSADGNDWQELTRPWDAIIGPYGDVLLGTKTDESGKSVTCCWPEGKVAQAPLPEGFPFSGFSAPAQYSTRWASEPTIVIFGGESYASTSGSWAFDGSSWTDIAEKRLPKLSGLSVMPYYSYLKNASNSQLREFDVLLAFGGAYPDGSLNEKVYISYDHGINWMPALEYMQLPEGITAGRNVDAVAINARMDSDLTANWRVKRRVNFEIDGDYVVWECPYIFLFGGYGSDNMLNSKIRSGVLRRLTFTPLF